MGDPVVVVTGGSGFVGHAVVDQLLEGTTLPAREVRILDLQPTDQRHERLVALHGDVCSPEDVRAAVRGADLVLHLAAVVDWGRVAPEALHAVHVEGTRNVIEACRAEGVGALVHTSSIDAVWTGRPIADGDESLPYAEGHVNGYCASKTEGEQLALAADGAALEKPAASGRDRLRVAVVRPLAIWGERDPYSVPGMLHMAFAGVVPRVGRRGTRCPTVYVGNCAHLLLLAGRGLLEEPPRGAGQVYFATDYEPESFFDLHRPAVEAAGFRILPRSLGLPRHPLREIGGALEATSRLLRPLVRFAPTLTRYAVDYTTLDCTIRTDKAARDLGYAPRFTREEAVERTVAWFSGWPR